MRTRLANLLAAMAVLMMLFAGAPAGATAPRANPSLSIIPEPGDAFLHLATGSTLDNGNTATDLDSLALNGSYPTWPLATNQIDPYGVSTPRDTDHYGMLYLGSPQRWEIFDEDSHAFPVNTAWNVFIPPQDSTLIVQTSRLTNTVGSRTKIDSSYFNDSPDALLFAVPFVDPPLLAGVDAPSGGVLYTHTLAVVYDNAAGRWAVMNADNSPMGTLDSFIVLRASSDEMAFQVTVSSANRVPPDGLALDNPATNNNPDALLLITQNHGTDVTHPAFNHLAAVKYDSGGQRWLIVHEDGSALADGESYNVLVIPPTTGFLVHQATPANTHFASTDIDAPLLNNNPYARVYVMHNWDPPESDNEIYNADQLGVNYGGIEWQIDNLNGTDIVSGTTFNVYYTLPRANSFNLSASRSNSAGYVLTATHPLLDQQPHRLAIITENYNPDNVPGWNYTNVAGLSYRAGTQRWTISSDSGTGIPISTTFNVLVPPVSSTFVVTSTGGAPDTFGNSLYLDNPLTNNRPLALVFATPRANGALDDAPIGVWYNHTAQQWAIFNEDHSDILNNQSFNVFVVERSYDFLPLIRR